MPQEYQVLFEEKQRFPRWLTILSLILPVLSAVVVYFVIKDKMNNPQMWPGIIIGFIALLLGPALLASFKLITQVRPDGLYISLFPFHISFKRFTFDQIKAYYPRKYSPLAEYGGWGIRFGRSGKAYNVRGNLGLQLEFTNGKKLLIGSKDPDLLSQAIDEARAQDPA